MNQLQKNILYYFLTGGLLVSLLGCNKQEETTTTNQVADSIATNQIRLTPEQEKNFGIVVGELQTQNVYDALVLNGTVEAPPQQTASVSFPMMGIIRSVRAMAGSQVVRGTSLATIESLEIIQLQEDYWKTVGQLTFAEQERQRQATLNQEEVGVKRKFQQAESEVRVLQATKKGIEAKLQMVGVNANALTNNQIVRMISLRAPIGGTVRSVQANIGKSVTAGESLFEIVNRNGGRIVLKVFEKDLDKVKVGQRVGLAQGSATITSIGNNFDATTRAVDVYAQPNGVSLLAGQYISAKIEAAPRQALVLPETAIVRTGETAHIFLKKPQGIYESFDIKTGVTQNGFVEVVFTQKPTFPIVVAGAQILQAELTKGEGEEE